MEHASLVVLTLLQLCRAHSPSPEWYAANLVNDARYSPKPLTDIFSESSFSTKNPIVVGSSLTSTDEIYPTALPGEWEKPISSSPSPSTNSLSTVFIPSQSSQITLYDKSAQSISVQAQINQANQQLGPYKTTQTLRFSEQSTVPFTQTTGAVSQSWTPPTSISSSISSKNCRTPSKLPSSSPLLPVHYTEKTHVSPLGPLPSLEAPSMHHVASDPKNPSVFIPSLRIRVKSPAGSITNVNINPHEHATTTTTKKPTTTKTRRTTPRKKNNYDGCVDGCQGRKEPICAGPLAIIPIDPDTLKGFPSVCHMACHNSFRKDQPYEKVADGRCGKLRTRIRTVDKTKLKRDELHKSQYTVLHGGPETIVEFEKLK